MNEVAKFLKRTGMDEVLKFKVAIEGVGHVTLCIKRSVLNEVMSEEWQKYFYTFATEDEAVRALTDWIHTWPTMRGTQYSLDGIAHLTFGDLWLEDDTIDFRNLWDNATVERLEDNNEQ